MSNIEEKAAFMVMYPDSANNDAAPVLIIGLPDAAIAQIQGGLENSFDMTKVGIPVQIVLFGGGTHEQIMAKFTAIGEASGRPILDERRTDFGIATPGSVAE